MYGWAGNILRIDLTTGEIVRQPLEIDFARKWLGGEGFGAKLLWDGVGPEVEDGLNPGNLLIYATGPLTGTLAPSGGRLEIIAKSPLTGTFGDSNSGGHFAPEFKRAGYDVIVITGRAEKPVYLWIDDDQVEIKDASHLWGKTVSETDEMIKKELRDADIQISCIGPAGENQVRFAILMNNLDRAPAWSGCGAVAGSKNLKAVAARGTKGIRIARPEEFHRACWEAREKVTQSPIRPTMRKMGTMFLIRSMYLSGVGQLYNYSVSQCPSSHMEQISGERWADEYVVQTTGCHGCPMHCTHPCRVTQGPYAGLTIGGCEYGAITGYVYAYGSPSLAFGMKAVQYCNENGMDAAEPSYVIAWATDCFKRGIIDEKDTDGLVLEWGDEEVGLELLRKITQREGFGDMLAEGLGRAAQRLGRGSEYYAQTIKGSFSQENPTRAAYGLALASATSTRGADHLKGYPLFERRGFPSEMSRKFWGNPKAGDPFSHEGKAPMNTYYRHICTLMDTLGSCKFPSRWFAPTEGLTEEDYARMTSAATGIEMSAQDLMTVAERIYNLEHVYNVRLGMRRKDDTLPEMYFKEPFNTGPLEGHVLEKEKFDRMLDEYYQYWGWDVETGIPMRKTLERLDLKDVADELERRGLLSG
jgi:aldehyde:ferredoxin oxidoreductase